MTREAIHGEKKDEVCKRRLKKTTTGVFNFETGGVEVDVGE